MQAAERVNWRANSSSVRPSAIADKTSRSRGVRDKNAEIVGAR